jgi:hypothetical protein
MIGHGLQRVAIHHLLRLLRALHQEHLASPVTRSGLIACGFGDIEQHLSLLVGLERVAAQRVLVAVLAERRAREARPRLVPDED